MNPTNQDTIQRIQQALQKRGLAAWLFYGFHDIDPTAFSILQFPANPHVSRRWFYLVPAQGEPRKLVHRIESHQLDHLSGEKSVYLKWTELDEGLQRLLQGTPQVAMQYSPDNEIPYLSRVDAGTVEKVRSLGTEVVSSGDLVQEFEAVWSPAQLSQHRETAAHLTEIVQLAFSEAAAVIARDGQSHEVAIQRFILDQFQRRSLKTQFPPIVGVNSHSGDPHYSPTEASSHPVKPGDFLLIDLWAKPHGDQAVYADITWTGFFGKTPPPPIKRVFEVVRNARDRGTEFLKERVESGRKVAGWEVDDAVRRVIDEAGFGEFFVHRTGHNLHREVHGNGVHFDNLETRDTREVITGIACTIEPGIYRDDFGVRSEINIHIGADTVEVTTPPQKELLTFDV